MVKIVITGKAKGTHSFRKDDLFNFEFDPKKMPEFKKGKSFTATGIYPHMKGRVRSDGFIFDFVNVEVV